MTTVNKQRENLAIGKKTQKCDEIELLLFPYMSRELGRARSDLVHKHLRKCESCQAMAREIQDTMDALKDTKGEDDDTKTPRLTDEHRQQVYQAAMHPVAHWIEHHHTFISILITTVILVLVFLFMFFKLGLVRPFQDYEEWKRQNPSTNAPTIQLPTNAPSGETTIPVKIGRHRTANP